MGHEIHVSGHIDSLDTHIGVIVRVDQNDEHIKKVTALFRERFPECTVALWSHKNEESFKVLEHNVPDSDKIPSSMPGFVSVGG